MQAIGVMNSIIIERSAASRWCGAYMYGIALGTGGVTVSYNGEAYIMSTGA